MRGQIGENNKPQDLVDDLGDGEGKQVASDQMKNFQKTALGGNLIKGYLDFRESKRIEIQDIIHFSTLAERGFAGLRAGTGQVL